MFDLDRKFIDAKMFRVFKGSLPIHCLCCADRCATTTELFVVRASI